MKCIWTIGHSTRTQEDFMGLLHRYSIKILADIRSFPGSRKFPHFNKDALSVSLSEAGIQYIHLPELGGRRKPKPDSINIVWRNTSFRGYADYMETNEFKKGIATLEQLAGQAPLAYMCSEATWWRCHRALVSDYLKAHEWKVLHIMSATSCNEHTYTAPARKQMQGNLF
jgi:uncharacterized protein (DUF488 family)